jgi:predicted RNA-binding protein YlqC (UPF0109 family)
LKEFIETLVKQLVDKPDEVYVTESTGERTIICEVKVGEGDMGKIIGKKGQTAHSLRTLISAVSKKMGRRTVMEIIE